MKKRNIFKNIRYPLESHKDKRGRIVDVFYRENLNHVAVVDSKAGALRGDHYHKKTVQHILIIKGALEYWYKPVGFKGPAKFVLLKEGDLVTTPAFEIHALKIVSKNQFVAFSEGLRGGKDYESDTFRVKPTIIGKSKK